VFTKDAPYSLQITANVSYGECSLWSEARRLRQNYQCEVLQELAEYVQKARNHFCAPAIITSGYRPPEINRMVGGAASSEHLYDTPQTGALDFYLDGVPVSTLQSWCSETWPYSLGLGAPKGFVHVGIRPGRPKVVWAY
jgi:uncharacterized protein YcbK (DUF882 family)